MNCEQIRGLLPMFVYGDLPPAGVATVEQHCTECPACRQEVLALTRTRRRLDAVPDPPACAVDVGLIYREAAARQTQAARRWRRLAFAGGVAAAAAVVLFALNLEVRV